MEKKRICLVLCLNSLDVSCGALFAIISSLFAKHTQLKRFALFICNLSQVIYQFILSKDRILTCTMVESWMIDLEKIMKEEHFPPQLLFNMDETMVDPSLPHLKVITSPYSPQPVVPVETKSEHISFVMCITASGQYIRPLCILPLKTLPPLQTEVQNFFYISGQNSGFISSKIYAEWITTLLIPYINQTRMTLNCPNQKALLIVDRHVTRQYLPAIEVLKGANVKVVELSPHSSHILQPLDLSCLSCHNEFKQKLRHLFEPMEKEDLSNKRNRLLHCSVYALQCALTGWIIKIGFARTGIFPFYLKAPLQSSSVKNFIQEEIQPVPKRRKRGIGIIERIIANGQDITIEPPPLLPSLPPSSSQSSIVNTTPQAPIVTSVINN